MAQDIHQEGRLKLKSETVGSVTATGRVSLDRCQVEGSIDAKGRVNLEDTVVKGDINCTDRMDAEHCTVEGGIQVDGRLKLKQTQVNRSIEVGDRLDLESSTVDGDISVQGRASVEGSTVKGSIKTDGRLSLFHTTVQGDVEVDQDIAIEDSEVKGTVTASVNYLVIKNARLNHLRLYPGKPGSGGNICIQAGTIISGNISAGGGGATISGNQFSVQPGASILANGYKISATDRETTVIVPDGTIYVNGTKVHGTGPDTYAQYLSDHSNVPAVQGPGWVDTGASPSQSGGSPSPQIVVELRNGTEVQGDIEFIDAPGKVIIDSRSTLHGQVHNGTQEPQ